MNKKYLLLLLALAVAVTQPVESVACPEHKHEDIEEERELTLPEPLATIVCI